MKIHMVILIFLGVMTLHAQSPHDIQENLFRHLSDDVLILNETALMNQPSTVKTFVSGIEAGIYKKVFSKAVNPQLTYEIGDLQTASKSYDVMFLKQTNNNDQPIIEFLVMFEKEPSDKDFSAINKSRDDWMTLCNSHQARKLVEQLYTVDCYYYNRGRLLQGTQAISNEYAYMNDPNYALQLTPKHLVKVTAGIAYEIGQCSGSYPLPYMLVWEKQKEGHWQILMDSNY